MSHGKRVRKSNLQIATEVVQELDFLGYDAAQIKAPGVYGEWDCFEVTGEAPEDSLCIQVSIKGNGWRHWISRQSPFTQQEQDEFCRRTREALEKLEVRYGDENGVITEAISSLSVTKEVMTYQTPSSWADILTM